MNMYPIKRKPEYGQHVFEKNAQAYKYSRQVIKI